LTLAAGKPEVEVALETGFCDQSHFARAFKKKFGIPPGHYLRPASGGVRGAARARESESLNGRDAEDC